VVAGVLSLEEAVLLAVERGRFLQRAAAGGRMARSSYRRTRCGRRWPAWRSAWLSPPSTRRLVVVSGDPAALEELLARLRGAEVFCRILAPGFAFHSPRIEPSWTASRLPLATWRRGRRRAVGLDLDRCSRRGRGVRCRLLAAAGAAAGALRRCGCRADRPRSPALFWSSGLIPCCPRPSANAFVTPLRGDRSRFAAPRRGGA